MSRRLLVLNVGLGIVSVALAVGIARTLLVKRPVPGPAAPRAASAPAPPAAAETADAGPAAYAVIAVRNLFSPARSETAAAPSVAVAKPILHGVVIDGAKRRAFLEHPSATRVAGYSVGDTVGGGKIEKISDDRVVIARPEGLVEVLLQDPSKPRAAPTVAAGPSQGVPQPVAPRPVAVAPGQVFPQQPGVQQAPQPNLAPAAPTRFSRRIPGQPQGQQGQPGND